MPLFGHKNKNHSSSNDSAARDNEQDNIPEQPPAAIGSAALREQGMLRDREAMNFHAQSEELAEAERLEQQAREHRARAVAQGADPANKPLGGGQPNHGMFGGAQLGGQPGIGGQSTGGQTGGAQSAQFAGGQGGGQTAGGQSHSGQFTGGQLNNDGQSGQMGGPNNVQSRGTNTNI